MAITDQTDLAPGDFTICAWCKATAISPGQPDLGGCGQSMIDTKGLQLSEVPDLLRSLLTFRIDLAKQPAITVSAKPPFTLNNARILLEARCLIHDRQTGVTTAYVLRQLAKQNKWGWQATFGSSPTLISAVFFPR
ncbi:MAG: hypothetical protein R3E79_26555 [Caldilineaceae bacterium]